MSDLPEIPRRPAEDGQPGLTQYAVGYEISAEVEAVANRLIGQHRRLSYRDDWELGYLLHHTDPPTEGGVHKLGAARLTPKHARPFSTVDATVSVNEPIWRALSERQREALVLHELLHLGTHEKTGELLIVPHDVLEFGFVAATYGRWNPALRDFSDQLALGLEADREAVRRAVDGGGDG